jgi:uncharacterized protein (TIGR03086 family)
MELDDLAHAQAAVGSLLASLDPAAWSRPTPCDEWDVDAVSRHLVIGERAFVTSLGGDAYDLADIRAEVLEIATEDLPTTYAVGARDLHLALAAADADATFPTGLGPMSAVAVTRLRMIEALVHGWDIASGAGATLEVDDDVAERAIRHSLALLERLPPERKVFADPQPVAEDSPALDRLVALLGRSTSA